MRQSLSEDGHLQWIIILEKGFKVGRKYCFQRGGPNAQKHMASSHSPPLHLSVCPPPHTHTPSPHQTPSFELWFGQRTTPQSLLCLLTPHNSTLIAVLNLISKWARWLEKPDNGECNLSGHKHRCVHISEHRCTPREVGVRHAWLAFDFTRVITVSFVPKAAFFGGEAYIQHQTPSQERESAFISTDTFIFVHRHNFDE